MRSAPAFVLASVLAALPVLAEGAPTDLKVDASAVKSDKAPPKPVTREDMIKRSGEVTRGYYNALIKGDFEVAASFVHPGTVEPLRKTLTDEVEKAPPAKQKGTLDALGVPDLNTLRTMPAGKFFAAYAKSSYGIGLRALSSPEYQALRPSVEDQTCIPEKRFCRVTVRIKGKKKSGGELAQVSVVNHVFVVESGGRWLVNDKPPQG